MYEIRIQQFEGPLDLLLKLIETQELDISNVSLSQVTEQYLEYLETVEQRYPEELADFLVVATKLILMKSRLLLPELPKEDDEDGETLAEQLRIYKEYLDASHMLATLIAERHFLYSRSVSHIPIEPVFSPPPDLQSVMLRDSFQYVLASLEVYIHLPEQRLERTISLQEKLSHLYDLITNKAEVSFHGVLAGAKTKAEVVVTFLALLELVKRRIVHVRQHHDFGDIAIVGIHSTHVGSESPPHV
ncbi:MAG: segregation/condensation protein A [Candidatus Kerfeldbacteria bacterium]|nr:segregation/condensation protein A [Candidatus Kerfeldbacteria bacterium]